MRRIIVVRPNHRLGNALLLTPLIAELENSFPMAEIEVVCTGSSAKSVFKNYPTVSAIHSFPSRSYRKPGEVLQLLWTLSRRPFDLAVDPVARSRAGRFVLGQVRAREKLGFRWNESWRDRMLTDAIDPTGAPAHLGRTPLHLLRTSVQLAAGDASSNTAPGLDIRLSSAERRVGRYRLLHTVGERSDSPLIGFFANATGKKNYPVDWWRSVVSKLRHSTPQARFVEFVPADGNPRLASDMPNVRSPDLRILGAMIAATDCMVVADGGIMHLGVAAKARVLGLFKVTNPDQYGPNAETSEALRVADEQPDLAAAVIRTRLVSQGNCGGVSSDAPLAATVRSSSDSSIERTGAGAAPTHNEAGLDVCLR